MMLRMDLFVWIKGNMVRTIQIPPGKEDAARAALTFFAREDFRPLLEKANLPLDFMTSHIDTFLAELDGEDRDHTYRWHSPDDLRDIRLVIENVSPATQGRHNKALDDILERGVGGAE
jgi:hypothetical protein